MTTRTALSLALAILLTTLVSCSSKAPKGSEISEAEIEMPLDAQLAESRKNRNLEYQSLQQELAASGHQPAGPASSLKQSASMLTPPASVEMLWRVPQDTVLAYHLYFGEAPDKLSEHLRVPVENLERIIDSAHGPVYRYKLMLRRNLPIMYFSIRAENENGVSGPSKAIRVPLGNR